MKSAFGNAYFVLILCTFLWGGNAVAGKLASQDWQPFTITSLRWLLASILVLPFAWKQLKEDWALIRTHWLVLVALGALGMSMFQMLMFLAANYTSAINISILQASMPVMIMLANFVLFSQRTSTLQIGGLVISICGVLITTTGGKPWLFFVGGLNIGDAFMLAACFFYAAYTIGLRWRPKMHWLSFIWVIAVSAFLMTVPFALWELQTSPFTMPSLTGWIVLAYVVIFASIVAQISFARGVELIGGNRAGQFINLVPIFGSLLAIIILKEKFHWYHGTGLVMVVGGIWLAERYAATRTV